MNKKLVALAVAGAFALPLAAEAQTANVTLYGRLNMDLEFVRGQQADERFAAAQVAGVGGAVDRRLDLEDGVETAAEAVGAAHA